MDTPAPRRRFDLVAYLKLVRFPLVFTAIADSAAGYFIGRLGGDDPITPTLGLLALSSAGLYLSGMALNDIADLPKVDELSDALGFELPPGLSEPTETTSPLPFDETSPASGEPAAESAPATPEQDSESVH